MIINEIQYDPTAGSDAEYLELRNLEDTAIDLSGWSLDEAIELEFAGGTVIPANGYLVFARDTPTFVATYGSGIYVGGDHGGRLSNDGEEIRLLDADGGEVDVVEYGAGAPWPDSGDGPSLERIDPGGRVRRSGQLGPQRRPRKPGRSQHAAASR